MGNRLGNTTIQLILRVTLLSLTVMAGAWITLRFHNIAAGIFFGLLLVLQAGLLVHYFNRVNRKIAFFFDAVENEDSALRFSTRVKNKSERELNRSLNRINGLIQQAKAKNREQEQFYQAILEHVSTGIIIHDRKGNVIQANSGAKRLLQLDQFTHLVQLKRISNLLYQTFLTPGDMDRQSVKLRINGINNELALRSTTFTAQNRQLRLVSINDIQSELDAKESDAWIRLIRVLSHEIMNSIAPITSLSETLMQHLSNDADTNNRMNDHEQLLQNTKEGLEVIRERGNDLVAFVKTYRKLTRIPQPEKNTISVSDLLDKIRILSSTSPGFHQTKFDIEVNPQNLELFADENQITHVLINLVKNALEAIEGQSDAQITIKAGKTGENCTLITVKDNGKGIADTDISQIFIPFYTTKSKGSGIGLSFSRQVMRMHGGTITVDSKKGRGTVFKLFF